jgi:quercetin dioxygenase-like cupin family protein
MKPSRRELALLLPALAAAQNTGQPAKKQPSTCFVYEDLPVRKTGQNEQRALFTGATHTGYQVEMHITKLAPGLAPHDPHRHVHEEMVMVQEGTLEVTVEGKSTRLTPGSVAYIASNEMHGWKNADDGPCEYFILTLRGNA